MPSKARGSMRLKCTSTASTSSASAMRNQVDFKTRPRPWRARAAGVDCCSITPEQLEFQVLEQALAGRPDLEMRRAIGAADFRGRELGPRNSQLVGARDHLDV